MKIRNWQKNGFEKVDQAFSKDGNQLVSVAAAVGSGKTLLSSYVFGKFIHDHKNEKTVQIFLCPRINLCTQQDIEIKTGIHQLFEELEADRDFTIQVVNCENKSYNKNNDYLPGNHTIFVICDESLWGTDPNLPPDHRWNSWISKFKQWSNEGVQFGGVVYDEAHNYKEKIEKMTSEFESILKYDNLQGD